MSSEKTTKVLEKWGGENMNEDDIQKAAEMFAKIKVKNRFLKKVAFLGVVFMIAFLGLMLGSVILGAEVSKDFKLRNDVLVQRTGSGAIKTSELFYSVKLNLLTPLSTIQGLKSLKFFNKNEGSTIQFNVISFYYVYGRNLTLYGHTHMANVLGSGEVEFFPIKNQNGAKSIDDTRVVKTSDEDDLEAMSYDSNGNNGNNGNGVNKIYDCTGLSNIGSTGKYSLMNNINCNISQPLLPNGFFGTFNGRGNTITLNMNINGPAALFAKVGDGAKFGNLFIAGTISGKGNCSAFAIEAYAGSKFLSCAVYATINCANINDDLNDYTNLGGFAAVIRNPGSTSGQISFKFSVNQGHFNSLSSNANKEAYTGGFYGRMGDGEYMNRRFNFTYSATNYTRYGNNSHVNRFGFKYVYATPQIPTNLPTSPPSRSDIQLSGGVQKRDPYIAEDCYNYDQTNQDFINMCLDWYQVYWFENQDCCSDFNSCPYISCDLYSQLCLYCRHKKDSVGDVPNIVPINQNMCGFDEF